MKISLALRAFVMALALIGWMAAPALAAPSVLSTDPEAGAEMHEPPGTVSIEFSEPLESTSGMKVVDECGDKVSLGNGTVGATAMNELRVEIGDAPHRGTYTVRYVATGVTGTSSDSFTFFVHGGSGCDGGGDGGHSGHGGNGTGNGEGEGRGNGDGLDGGGGGHDGHDGGSGGTSSQPSGGDHSGRTHTRGDTSDPSHSSGRHGGMDMNGADMNDKPNQSHNKKNHDRHADGGGENPPIAAGGTGIPSDVPTGATVVVALALAIALGLVGGWVLRVSTPN